MVNEAFRNAAVPETSRLVEEEEESWIPLVQEETPRSSQQIAAPNSSTSPPTRRLDSLEAAQKRLDSSVRLKQGLVDHPLNQGWRLFFKHLASEIWQLDVHLRLGIVLVIVGTFLQMLVWGLSFRWYHPRTIILLLVFAVSFIYLAPKNVEKQFEAFFRLLATPDKVFDVADYVDPTIMRRIFLALILIPTLLEMRTFGFLSKVMAESGFYNNASVGIILASFLMYQLKKQKATPRECIQRGIHFLYGFALLVSIVRVDLARLPALMGPFFLATGTLLLSYRDDDMNWLSRAVRHALRLTLRDVLASVGETVAEDEMLQLAMLRWIVDYWSYHPPQTPAEGASHATIDTERRPSPPTTSSFPVRTTPPQPAPHRELQWEELCPMLDMTTDQMIEEVPTHTIDYSERQSESRPSWTDSSAQTEDNGSLHNLKSMLAALNVDDRAKPAVMAYKQAVAAFPPTRRQAVLFSAVRRCPAMLMLFYRYMIASDLAFASTVTLLPFAIMEAFRILNWAEACQKALEGGAQTPETEQFQSIAPLILIPVGMDPMCILLSGDFYAPSHPPSLLQVWVNICSSVAALEMGLTAARCAQTTVAVGDFAANIISLAQFGVEVSQHGWVHGLTVMVQELIHLHATQSTGRNTKYASAAINAVRNGNIVARNVSALSEEAGGNLIIEPLLGVLSAIVGHGWLWGREVNQESTVTIEQIPVEEKASGRENTRKLSIKPEETLIEELPPAQDAEAIESGDGAQTNEPAIVAPDAISKNLPFPTNRDESTEDLSMLMQLIADAFEQGLILETEKNAFVETILEAGTGQHRGPSRPAVEQMERSLRGLMESAESEALPRSADRVTNESLPRSADRVTNESFQSPSQGESQEGTTRGPSVDPSAGEGIKDRFERKQVPPEMTESASDWRDLGRVPSTVNRSGADDFSRSVRLSFGASVNSSIDESNDQTPCLPDERLAVNPLVNEDKKGDEWVKWVGGSLAVLGAVAGGIVIANAAQSEGDERRRSDDHTGNTVYIEELDDDEENTNEWVSVSASNND